MYKFGQDELIELEKKIDLLEYASKTYDFRRAGMDSYVTSCPFHSDSDPSLFISPSKNLFHCFSCHVGGGPIQWLMTFEKMKFPAAVAKISELAGVDIENLKTCESLALFKSLKKSVASKKIETIERIVLPDSYMYQFLNESPQEWLDEGISAETMKHFGIRIDDKSNRIVYPVYDADFNLIGAKGRTRFAAYKTLKLQKYQNYQKIGTTDYFAGMKENYEEIRSSRSAIIFEGIKSVMKLYDWNWKTAIAAETSTLNDAQIIILIKMGLKEVTFALDNDVSIANIRKNTEKLRRYTNVYAVYDRHKRLQEKMSPCDAGREVWEQLYKERIKL